ncbi:MAG: ATP-binding protein [Deltaproteobacteria bacterium]|nr:ATP-binding protein [Deltaproteobacteria bacterium]
MERNLSSSVNNSGPDIQGDLLRQEPLPYLERLSLRPWEGANALMRLSVPPRLMPGYCPVITNWVVLTGATCAGKTTTIKALEAAGFNVVHEVARSFVEQEIKQGRSVREIRADDHWYRQKVFSLTLEEELNLMPRASELIFFDRSAADSLAFHRGSGYDPHEILQQLQPYRYAHIFHLNPLPFVSDGLRTANEPRRQFLDAAMERDYRALGYQPIRVPYLTVQQRIDFILERAGYNHIH